MASRRMIPTRFFKDPDIMALSSKDTQLILVGLALMADDEGREVAHAGLLGREMDYAPEIIEHALQELEENDLLTLYRVGKHRYYFLTRWNEWQTLGTKKRPSRYPAPPLPGAGYLEETPGEKCSFSREREGSQHPPENASMLPAYAEKRQHHVSQENQTEANTIEEKREANPGRETTSSPGYHKVIAFPILSTPANTSEDGHEDASSTKSFVQQVAQILQLEASDALARLVTEYACCSSLSLLGEADAAREWIDDGGRNRSHKSMSVAFFRRWLEREQEKSTQRQLAREQQARQWLAATGTTGTGVVVPSREVGGRLPSLMHLAEQDRLAREGRG